MILDKDCIGCWTFNGEEPSIRIKTKEYQKIDYVLEDAKKFIDFGRSIGLEPISFDLITNKKFELFSFSFNEYYRIFIEFKKLKRATK